MKNKTTPSIYKFNENFIYIEPIQTCNLRCILCYVDEKILSSKKMMDINELKEIITKIANPNIEYTFYFCGGGEVTLYPHLIELMNFLNEKYSCNIIIQTNGVVYKNTLEKLLEFDNVSYNISIDGDEKTHDENRGKNSYKKTLEFYKKLKNKGIEVNVRTLYSKNIDMESFLNDIGQDEEVLYTIPFQYFDIIKEEELILPKNFKPFEYNRNTYFSIKSDGIFSCCEGKERLGGFNTDVEKMKQKAINNNCSKCEYYLKCK